MPGLFWLENAVCVSITLLIICISVCLSFNIQYTFPNIKWSLSWSLVWIFVLYTQGMQTERHNLMRPLVCRWFASLCDSAHPAVEARVTRWWTVDIAYNKSSLLISDGKLIELFSLPSRLHFQATRSRSNSLELMILDDGVIKRFQPSNLDVSSRELHWLKFRNRWNKLNTDTTNQQLNLIFLFFLESINVITYNLINLNRKN